MGLSLEMKPNYEDFSCQFRRAVIGCRGALGARAFTAGGKDRVHLPLRNESRAGRTVARSPAARSTFMLHPALRCGWHTLPDTQAPSAAATCAALARCPAAGRGGRPAPNSLIKLLPTLSLSLPSGAALARPRRPKPRTPHSPHPASSNAPPPDGRPAQRQQGQARQQRRRASGVTKSSSTADATMQHFMGLCCACRCVPKNAAPSIVAQLCAWCAVNAAVCTGEAAAAVPLYQTWRRHAAADPRLRSVLVSCDSVM